jgi:transposase
MLKDPFSGHVFVFRNKPGTSIKILVYDGQGLCSAKKDYLKVVLNGGLKNMT